MKIELKNIKYSEAMSEETLAFVANLYVEGKRAGSVKNDGHGGNTHYSGDHKEGWEMIRQAEAFTRSLPDKFYPKDEYMEAFSIPMNLEHYIDDLLNDYLQKKELARFNKQMEKAMEKSIVFGVAGESFATITFTSPLSKVLEHPKGAEILVKAITEKILPKLAYCKILNNNIPESILKDAGLKENQYVTAQKPGPAIDNNEEADRSGGRKR